MPVGEVNCQAREKHHGSQKPGSLLPNTANLGSGFCEYKSFEGLTFSPTFFLFARKLPCSPPSPFPPFSLRGFLSSLIFPVYSTFPLLVISKPRVLSSAAVHSRKFHYPEGLGISEGPWMKGYKPACELEQLCFPS